MQLSGSDDKKKIVSHFAERSDFITRNWEICDSCSSCATQVTRRHGHYPSQEMFILKLVILIHQELVYFDIL